MAIDSGFPGARAQLTTADFNRVELLFAEAAALAGETRVHALDAACADRPDLRREVDALLAAHDRMTIATSDEEAPAPRIAVGSRIGAYHLVEQIGEGGMGEVYRAERVDGVFTQQVAVKITRSAVLREDLVRRFTVERQILASMHHVNIVAMLDGGATPEGQAYFVMEYVEGTPLTQHCRDQALPLHERLRLFQQICSAVHHAHRLGIVHRDLKPANILVTAEGVPKVLDFGVAKLLTSTPAAGTPTETGLLPGPLTPNYASPEQLRGLAITTASDIYALGVLLYELVAGGRPYETTGQPLDRVIDLVVRAEPLRPSAPRPAGADPLPYDRRRLRGDIDAIVLKALDKEPDHRYASAQELAADVGRVLDHRPVLARGPSAAYVLRRLAARHKLTVGVGMLAIAAVLVALAAAVWQKQVADRERLRSERRFAEVRQLANALIFKIHDAVAPLAGSTPVRRTIVDEALAYLERLERESGADDVTLRLELAAAYRQIGGILGDAQTANLGDRDGAIRQYERARAILLPLATETAQYDVVNALSRVDTPLSTLYSLKNDPDRSLAIAREAVDHATRYRQRNAGDGRGLETLASATFQLAWTSPLEERAPIWSRTLEYYEGLLAEKPEVPARQRNVALVEKYLGALLPLDQRAPHFKRAVELDEKRLAAAPDNRQAQFDTAISLAGLADSVELQGDLDEAARLLERSLAIRQRLADTDPANVQVRERLGYVLAHVARLQLKRGALSAARPRAQEAVRVLQGVLKVTNDRTAQDTLGYAWLEVGYVERAAGDRSASCRAFRRAHEMYSLPSSNAAASGSLRNDAAREAAACR